jgi:signal transduction histidine kinase
VSPRGRTWTARGRRYARRVTTAPAPSRRLALDALLAVAVFAATLGLQVAFDEGASDFGVLSVVLAGIASLPLAVRRRVPFAVFVVTAAGSVLLHGLVVAAGPPIGPTLALYFAAAAGDGSRGRTRALIAATVVLLLAHVSAVGLNEDELPWVPLLFGVLVWGGAWLAGDRTRLRRERMAELEERALRAEQEAERERRLAAAEERTRIARDLHDSAGHAINVILVHAGLGRMRSDDPEERERFETIEQVARETVGQIDQLVGALREDAGDAVEPPPGLASLDALLARHRAAGLPVELRVEGARRALPPAVDRGAYRILQEALTNAARHGGGGARVAVAYAPELLRLEVANPLGDGGASGGGHGLVGMRERAGLLGGELSARARDGAFHVNVTLPLGDLA